MQNIHAFVSIKKPKALNICSEAEMKASMKTLFGQYQQSRRKSWSSMLRFMESNIETTVNSAMMFEPIFQPNHHVRAEILNDMSAVALDFSNIAHIFGFDSEFQAMVLVGRLLSMVSACLPESSIEPDELAFQLFMIAAAAKALIQSTQHTSLYNDTVVEDTLALSYREHKVFHFLFDPVGLKKSQYSYLLSHVLDFVTVEPGEIISSSYKQDDKSNGDEQNTEDFTYWLYKGWVEVRVETKDKIKFFPKVSRLDLGMGLIDDLKLARYIANVETRGEQGRQVYQLPTIVKAGERGVTLLRINTKKLMEQLKEDDQLESSIRLLLIVGMQDKLNALTKGLKTSEHDLEGHPVH